MQTVITWTRYDGTPETLPKEGVNVVVSRRGVTGSVRMRRVGTQWRGTRGDCTEDIRIGDWHAPWPAAPQGGSDAR